MGDRDRVPDQKNELCVGEHHIQAINEMRILRSAIHPPALHILFAAHGREKIIFASIVSEIFYPA
jgi:hypothetical protein